MRIRDAAQLKKRTLPAIGHIVVTIGLDDPQIRHAGDTSVEERGIRHFRGPVPVQDRDGLQQETVRHQTCPECQKGPLPNAPGHGSRVAGQPM